MARIRTIKPDIWESEKVGRLSILARLNFIGLISLADDEGRGRASTPFLKARIHPYAYDVDDQKFTASLEEIGRHHLACFYKVNGDSYYFLPGWADHQKIDRPSKSTFPPPTEEDGFDEHSTNTRRGIVTGREGKGGDARAQRTRRVAVHLVPLDSSKVKAPPAQATGSK